MPFDKSGTLIINATAAGGALPIQGIVVRVTGSDEENRTVEYSTLTDIDGISKRLILPAPSRDISQSPGALEAAYALYNIEISAPGYYNKRIYNVAVFDGEETVQPVNMIPVDLRENSPGYPRNNLNTVVRENEMLE